MRAFDWLRLKRLSVARLYRKILKQRKRYLQFDRARPSDWRCDLLSLTVEKDLPVFGHAVVAMRENLLHPVGEHFVLAPNQPAIRAACRELGCTFVDERELLPGGPEEFRALLPEKRKYLAGWLYQQFLKLSAGALCRGGRFIVADADTVILNPVRYEWHKRVLFDISEGYRSDLDLLHRRLLGPMRLSCFSFMCHIMLMEEAMLSRLQDYLQRRFSCDWRSAIVRQLDLQLELPFSEFELYANFARNQADYRTSIGYWFNLDLPRSDLGRLAELKSRFRGKYKSLSFHSYRK